MRRLKEFLGLEASSNVETEFLEDEEANAKEKVNSCNKFLAKIENSQVEVRGASIGWRSSADEANKLQIVFDKIDFTLEKGSTYIITGRVATGKSTLLKTILSSVSPSSISNSIQIVNGSVQGSCSETLENKIAYVSQGAWIRSNVSIKENVVFFRDFDEKKYERALKMACLEKDLEQFQEGDGTLVGEGS